MPYHFYKHKFKTSEKQTINRAMLVVSVIHPLAALPQAFEIYQNQSAQNVSLITWLSFMFIGIVFTMYAYIHKLTPMLLNQAIWFIVDTLIVAGIILYG